MICLLWQNLSMISCTASHLHPTDAETKASLWGEATAIIGTLSSSSQALEEYSFRFHTLRLLSKLLISNLYPPSSFKFTFPCSSSNIKWGMMETDLRENQILTSDVRLYALPDMAVTVDWVEKVTHDQLCPTLIYSLECNKLTTAWPWQPNSEIHFSN